MRLGLVSLGCDKNTVDSERMLARLAGAGARRVRDLREADVILVNTCGFIDAAKEESIETLLDAARLKREGGCRSVVAVGCMVERHREELEEALPEVDLFLGLRDLDRLVPELRSRGLLGREAPAGDGAVERADAGAQGERAAGRDAEGARLHPGERLPLGDRHVRYLKVSEGCDHGCAFCAIPLWRGRHRSFDPERLVAEARRLEAQGAVELNLVAQDLAHYGRDRRDGTEIAGLVRRILDETSIPWLRLLYIYSAGLREPLVELMASEPRLLPYVDMPIQHASDRVLERMRRPERSGRLREKVAWLRDAIPELTLRTTVLVGFPGETERDFRALLDFLEEVEFDRLGAFSFSPQDGTRAAGSDAPPVPEDVARGRLEEVVEVQRAISAERLAAEVGRTRLALVERPADPADPVRASFEAARAVTGARVGGAAGAGAPPASPAPWQDRGEGGGPGPALGRIASQADDVDGVTLLYPGDAPGTIGWEPGTLVEAEVVSSEDYDLAAVARRVVRPAGPPAEARGRPLPVLSLGLETAWGR